MALKWALENGCDFEGVCVSAVTGGLLFLKWLWELSVTQVVVGLKWDQKELCDEAAHYENFKMIEWIKANISANNNDDDNNNVRNNNQKGNY